MIQDVPKEQTFWLKDGKTIKNLPELARELRRINAEIFTHHVNNEKNDFANWTENCVKDSQLATLLRTTKNQQRMTAIVERKIQQLTQTPKKERKQIPAQTEPTIIRTKNITLLNLKHTNNVIKTDKITQLHIGEPKKIVKTDKITKLKIETPRNVIQTPHKTTLQLNQGKEIYYHEIKRTHYTASLLIGHVMLGLVMGVAIGMLIYAFG